MRYKIVSDNVHVVEIGSYHGVRYGFEHNINTRYKSFSYVDAKQVLDDMYTIAINKGAPEKAAIWNAHIEPIEEFWYSPVGLDRGVLPGNIADHDYVYTADVYVRPEVHVDFINVDTDWLINVV